MFLIGSFICINFRDNAGILGQSFGIMTKSDSSDHWVTRELRAEAEALVANLAGSLHEAIAEVDNRIAMPAGPDEALADLHEPLPQTGCGCRPALEKLLEFQKNAGTNTAGPRCYHFVTGGNTP